MYYPSPSPSGAMTVERLIWLEYNIELKLYSFKAESCQKYALFQRTSNESCSELNFVQAVREHVCIPPPTAGLWPSKDWNSWNIILYWNWKSHSFRAERCQKYALFQRKLQMKAVQNWISYKNSEAYVSLPIPSGATTFERLIWLKYNILLKLQITFIYGWVLPKVRIISKKTSNESCSKLRCMFLSSPSPPVELRPLKDWYD